MSTAGPWAGSGSTPSLQGRRSRRLRRASTYRALAGNIAAWCAVLAAAALLGEFARRRFWPRLQWNLRVMLVALGACCAFLAWCAALHRHATRQDAIIAQIHAIDGGVHLKRWGPRWLNLLGADPYRRNVVGVALGYVEQPANLLPVLKLMPSLPGLRRLDLDGIALTEAEVAELAHLTNLQELFLNDTGIGDADLARLRGLSNLRLLHLGGCPISDDALAHLDSFTRLESLYLSATAIRGHGLKHLSQLPRLRLLDLAHSHVEPEALRSISGLQALEELYLDCTAIHDAAAIPRPRLPRLRLLDLAASEVGDDALDGIDGGRPSPPERRSELGQRQIHGEIDGGDSVDELPRYGGAGFY